MNFIRRNDLLHEHQVLFQLLLRFKKNVQFVLLYHAKNEYMRIQFDGLGWKFEPVTSSHRHSTVMNYERVWFFRHFIYFTFRTRTLFYNINIVMLFLIIA